MDEDSETRSNLRRISYHLNNFIATDPWRIQAITL